MDLGTLRFWNARVGLLGKTIEIAQLGSGTYDHLGFFGSTGHTSAVQVNQFQDTSIIVDDAGNPLLTTFGGSGYCTNNKRIGADQVSISGLPEGPYVAFLDEVNIFHPTNIAAYPNFRNRPSGTLLVTYQASGSSLVNVFSPKLFAYDALGSFTDPPVDVDVFGYEINGSGQWYNTSVSGVWQQTTGQNNPVFLAHHSQSRGWEPKNEHYFVMGICVRPTSVGVIADWNLGFSLTFA